MVMKVVDDYATKLLGEQSSRRHVMGEGYVRTRAYIVYTYLGRDNLQVSIYFLRKIPYYDGRCIYNLLSVIFFEK